MTTICFSPLPSIILIIFGIVPSFLPSFYRQNKDNTRWFYGSGIRVDPTVLIDEIYGIWILDQHPFLIYVIICYLYYISIYNVRLIRVFELENSRDQFAFQLVVPKGEGVECTWNRNVIIIMIIVLLFIYLIGFSSFLL